MPICNVLFFSFVSLSLGLFSWPGPNVKMCARQSKCAINESWPRVWQNWQFSAQPNEQKSQYTRIYTQILSLANVRRKDIKIIMRANIMGSIFRLMRTRAHANISLYPYK